jgi:hypothetical protein
VSSDEREKKSGDGERTGDEKRSEDVQEGERSQWGFRGEGARFEMRECWEWSEIGLLNDLDEEPWLLSPSPEPPDPSLPRLFLNSNSIFGWQSAACRPLDSDWLFNQFGEP